MSDHQAEIIPFPARTNRAEAPVPDAQARLEQALARLDLAMVEQREALANWRSALQALKHSAGSLEAGLRRYQSELGALGEKVAGLGASAQLLQSWGDGAGPSAPS